MPAPRCLLFHELADPESARVRREIVARRAKPLVSFENLSGPRARQRWRTLGGTRIPALWDGERLHEGAAAILVALDAIIARQ